MELKFSDFSTVIIVNKTHGHTRSLQIKTKHLRLYKHYIAIIAAVIVCLCLSVFYLNYRADKQEVEKQNLLSQISRLEREIPPPVSKTNTADKAQTYIQGIETKLKKINSYLTKRGLSGFSVKTTDADKAAEAKLSDADKYEKYNDHLNRLVSCIAFIPMGYPRLSGMSSFFGGRTDPFNTEGKENHPGIDFKGSMGDPVKCTASGKIIFAGWYGGYGNCIRIQHTNGLETLYGHLSKIGVKEGQSVNVGDVIGAVGSTGHSTGAHLHYEVRKNGRPINPVNYLTLNS
ncbi:M23 family metallopeptidase [Mucilaginibacter sp. HMF5004]|uniref:M23 family metallopeptidase n=1 Tax=Mucilaginibacter rivuli TaxID=2857527 RepID=UPI001C5F236F|nr:M23 family metallopeptidase [Mucilaginibacter rivuli]MBW4891220.1 M23 family metallopeptidase [Mucilaginibacter rivuli]